VLRRSLAPSQLPIYNLQSGIRGLIKRVNTDLWKLRFKTSRNMRLLPFKVGSFNAYTRVPSFLPLPEATLKHSRLGGVVVSVLATGPKGRGFKPDRQRCILREIKIRGTTSYGGEVNPWAPCRKVLRHVKNTIRYDRDTDRQNSADIFRPVSPCCLLLPEQRRLVGGSKMIRTQMGAQ
jgi:hypothetical protein